MLFPFLPLWVCYFPNRLVSHLYLITMPVRSDDFSLRCGLIDLVFWIRSLSLHLFLLIYKLLLEHAFCFALPSSGSPSLSFHVPHSALICMWACASLGVPDNLSEVLLKLMRGDSIRLQTPLINLSRSTSTMHANELFKCVGGALPSKRQKGMCLNSIEDWVLNWTKRTIRNSPVTSTVCTEIGQIPNISHKKRYLVAQYFLRQICYFIQQINKVS